MPTAAPPGSKVQGDRTTSLVTTVFLVVLVAACVAVFWPATRHEFVAFDDDGNIYLNEHLGGLSLDRIRWAFTSDEYVGRYFPLGCLTYAVAFSLWGLDPAGYHVGTVLLHAVSAMFVFLVLRTVGNRLAPGTGTTATRTVAAGLAAAWWALHPMRAEVVGWATCLIYIIQLLFLLGAFAAALAAEIRPAGTWRRRGFIWLGGLSYCAALLTYPAAAGALALVVAYDIHRSCAAESSWTARARELAIRLREKLLSWIVPGAAIVVFSYFVTRSIEPPATGTDAFSLGGRLARVPLMLAHHLLTPWWPSHLTPVNDLLIDVQLSDGLVLGSLLLVALVTIGAGWLLVRARSGPAALWLAFAGALFPLCGLTQVVQFPADRYAYFAALPLVAVLYFALLGAGRWFPAAAGALAVVTIAWVPAARAQLAVWQNTETLLQHCLTHLRKDTYQRPVLTLRLARTHFLYGGDIARTRELIGVAERAGWAESEGWRLLREQLERQGPTVAATGVPPVAWDHRRFGRMFAARGEFPEAIAHFRAALRLAPHFPEARADLAILLPEGPPLATGTPP